MLLFYLLAALTLAAAGFLVIRYAKSFSQPEPLPLSRKLLPILGAIVTALCLYWLSVTAATRSVAVGPSGLFSLVPEGRPLMGRLIRLCVCVLLSFGLFLTPAGQKIRKALAAALARDAGRWLCSAVITALLFLWILRVTVLCYMTSDETGILSSVLAVANRGLAAGANSFSHVLFCGLLGGLYALFPHGYWYAWYHVAALLFSLVVIGRCILLKTSRLRWPFLCGVLLQAVFCGGMFLYAFAQLSFTVTPAVVGSAAVALVLCRHEVGSHRAGVILDVLGVLLMLLCYLQRPSTGRCLLCFWALAVAFQLVHLLRSSQARKPRQFLSLGVYTLAVLLLLGSCRLITRSGSYSSNAAYWRAESYRSLIMDYLIDDLTYEQFEQVGIPQELAVLLHGWYFMDERINTDTFKALADLYYTENPSAASISAETAATLPEHLAALLSYIRSDPQMHWRAISLPALLILALAAFLRYGREFWPEFLCSLFAMGGAFLLCLYLVIEGRFPTRVFLVVALPALVTMLLMALSVPGDIITPRKAPSLSVISGLSLAVLTLCAAQSVYTAPYTTEMASRETVFGDEWAIEDHLNANPNLLFITNIYDSNLDPFDPGLWAENERLWGDGGDTYRTDRLYGPDFFRDDVRFLCQNPGYIMFMLQYLSLDNGPVQAVLTDALTQNVVVYDISQVSPGESYTGWYERNGFTYYFQDGQALTGTQIIDGAEYEFAPAGGASMMSVLNDDGGSSVYTTKAYSLIDAGE